MFLCGVNESWYVLCRPKPNIWSQVRNCICDYANHYCYWSSLKEISNSFTLFFTHKYNTMSSSRRPMSYNGKAWPVQQKYLTFTFAICHRPSVCLSSVTFVCPTQAIEISGYDLSITILRRSSQGNSSVGGVKHKRGSRI